MLTAIVLRQPLSYGRLVTSVVNRLLCPCASLRRDVSTVAKSNSLTRAISLERDPDRKPLVGLYFEVQVGLALEEAVLDPGVGSTTQGTGPVLSAENTVSPPAEV